MGFLFFVNPFSSDLGCLLFCVFVICWVTFDEICFGFVIFFLIYSKPVSPMNDCVLFLLNKVLWGFWWFWIDHLSIARIFFTGKMRGFFKGFNRFAGSKIFKSSDVRVLLMSIQKVSHIILKYLKGYIFCVSKKTVVLLFELCTLF